MSGGGCIIIEEREERREGKIVEGAKGKVSGHTGLISC